jgi:hypothetical protein
MAYQVFASDERYESPRNPCKPGSSNVSRKQEPGDYWDHAYRYEGRHDGLRYLVGCDEERDLCRQLSQRSLSLTPPPRCVLAQLSRRIQHTRRIPPDANRQGGALYRREESRWRQQGACLEGPCYLLALSSSPVVCFEKQYSWRCTCVLCCQSLPPELVHPVPLKELDDFSVPPCDEGFMVTTGEGLSERSSWTFRCTPREVRFHPEVNLPCRTTRGKRWLLQ